MTHVVEGHEAFFYFVKDMTVGVNFYRDVLGLNSIVVDEYWSVFLLPDGGKFGLHLASSDSEVGSGGQTPMIILRVKDVRQSISALTEKGVKVVTPYISQSWGEEADIADPDGNVLRIARLAQS